MLQFLVERLERIDIGEDIFASIKERMARSFDNQRLQQPYRQSRYFTRMLLETPNFTREALQAALATVNLQELKDYAASQLRETYLEGVVVGNLSRDSALRALRKALDTLHADVLPPAGRVQEQVLELPTGANWIFSDRLSLNNSLMHFTYQVGKTNPTLRGALLLISRPMSQQFYHQMRTRQQLGYIVWAGMGQMRKTLNLSFLVQSGQYPADELYSRMEAFVPGFIESFKTLPESPFEQFREAVIRAKLQRAKTLGEIAERLFWMAFLYDEKFDHVSEDIAAVEALTRSEVEAVLTRYLSGAGEKRLSIRLIGRDHESNPPKGKIVTLPASVRAKAG